MTGLLAPRPLPPPPAACRLPPAARRLHALAPPPPSQAEFFSIAGLTGYDPYAVDAAEAERDAAAGGDGDTIAAIVTGAQQGAVSIIRLSGPEAVPIAQRVFRTGGGGRKQEQQQQQQRQQGGGEGAAAGAAWEPESHRVYYGRAVDGQGRVLDEVRAAWRSAGAACNAGSG